MCVLCTSVQEGGGRREGVVRGWRGVIASWRVSKPYGPPHAHAHTHTHTLGVNAPPEGGTEPGSWESGESCHVVWLAAPPPPRPPRMLIFAVT